MNTAEVLNTPGYYYAIAYALSVFVIACTNERKLGRWKLAAVSCVQFALLLFFMTVTDGVRQELFVPSMSLIVLLLLGYIYICNDFSLREAGFYFVKAFINGEFAASLCWQIYYYLRYVRGIQGELLKWVELILVYAVIFTILALMELNLKKDLEELHITRRELLVVIIIAASVFAMSNLSYLDHVESVVVSTNAYYHFIRARAESETAPYRADMYEKREEEQRWMEELFRSWGVTNAATQEMVARRYIERMVGCIANVTSSKCTLSGKEQRAEIRKMLHNPRVDKALALAKPRSGYMKVMLLPIRWKNVTLAWMESSVITFVKEHNGKLFARMKAGR